MRKLNVLICALILQMMQVGIIAQDSIPSPPALPDDPLHINLEATFYRTNTRTNELTEYTAYFEEYRDSVNNRALAITVFNSSEIRYYYDIDAKQGFTVIRNLSVPLEQAYCTTQELSVRDGSFVSFGFSTSAGGGLLIAGVSSFFQWSNDQTRTFMGYREIRGIRASTWFVPESDKTTYNLTYYFSDSHAMPYYYGSPVLLRVEMVGSSVSDRGSYTFRQVYDFNLVAPLEMKDDTFFATPAGVYCPHRKVPPGSERKFVDQYVISEQIVIEKNATVDYITTYVDSNLNLTRMDYDVPEGQGYRRMKLVHDFAHDYQMLINIDKAECKVTRIPKDGRAAWDVAADDKGSVKLKLTQDRETIKNAAYQGKRIENGIPVDVWSSIKSLPNDTVKIMEMWYTHPSWKVRSSQALSTSYSVHAGLRILVYNKNTHKVLSRMTFNAFNQYYGPIQVDSSLSKDAFDVPECYSRDAVANEHLNFLVEDTILLFSGKEVTREAISGAVKSHFSKLGSISPTRIVNVNVYEESSGSNIQLKIYFTLRSRLSLSESTDLDKALTEADNTKAIATLNDKMLSTDGILLPVTTIKGEEKHFLIVSELSNDHGTVNDEVKGKSPPKMYSKAAMAGLGLGMLILGALLTVIAGGIVWIKRFDINIPYLAQSNE